MVNSYKVKWKSLIPSLFRNGSFIAEHWARSFRNHSATRDCDIRWTSVDSVRLGLHEKAVCFRRCRTVMRLSRTSSPFFPNLLPGMPSAWQGFSLYYFLSLWKDPAGYRIHSLPHAKQAICQYANAGPVVKWYTLNASFSLIFICREEIFWKILAKKMPSVILSK